MVVFEPHTFSWRDEGALGWYDSVFEGVSRVLMLPPPVHGAESHSQLSQSRILDRMRAAGVAAEAVADGREALEALSGILRGARWCFCFPPGPWTVWPPAFRQCWKRASLPDGLTCTGVAVRTARPSKSGSPMLNLSDPDLLRANSYIDGAWSPAADGARFNVTNPATGEVLSQVSDLDDADTRAAVAAAHRALPGWRARTGKERAGLMQAWFDLITAASEDLARLMTAEQGKPLAETRGEIAYGASFIEWFAEEAKRVYGDVIPATQTGKRILVTKSAVGVVAAITPWNFPNAMITRKAGPALAAGCTFVIKPSEETPLSALALAELANRAGIPAGVFNVVPSTRAQSVGAVLTSEPAYGNSLSQARRRWASGSWRSVRPR